MGDGPPQRPPARTFVLIFIVELLLLCLVCQMSATARIARRLFSPAQLEKA
jgi:hypothetical protein